ncbi:TetR/AcrR family transcriptional regulator [Nocardia crassostreae]|uniref:TetR/AcrR family transcriptional regulator n=1 Tax=Nocardia crassostreae TaxID=53428 RepID=UPI001C3FB28F|nr:TetR/AcrR family transcriptional regulator [Nocardia crassostreae]
MPLNSRNAAQRPLRADARRNYERLLDEARKVFAESGIDASLDEIARRAGVASGTLYRHFPTRLDLIEAVLGEGVAELAALGRELRGEPDSAAAVAMWLRTAVGHALGFRGLSAAVLNSALDGGPELVARWHAEMFEVGGALLDKARTDGVVTAAVADADVLRMIGGIAWAAQQAPDPRARAEALLDILLRALGPD